MVDTSLAAQAFIACVASAANYVSITDPSNGRMPDESKDKPVDRVWGSYQDHPIFSKIMFSLRNACPFVTLSQAGYLAYLALNPKKVKFPTKYATSFFLVTILGASWRIWCFRTLDKFFTFRLQVQDDQKVIKTGPYRYLAHPSYLGQSVNVIGSVGGTYGPFNVWMNMLNTKTIGTIKMIKQLQFLFGKRIVLNPRLLAQVAACVLSIAYLGHQYWLLQIRIPDEEAMLRKRFGKEYDEYLSRRWKVVPFIY